MLTEIVLPMSAKVLLWILVFVFGVPIAIACLFLFGLAVHYIGYKIYWAIQRRRKKQRI